MNTIASRAITIREFDNIQKLKTIPKMDFFFDPNQCYFEQINGMRHLVVPKIPGVRLNQFLSGYSYYDNGLKYHPIDKNDWIKLMKSFGRFIRDINNFHTYFTHNDISTSNIIYDGELMSIIDFETLKDRDKFSTDRDFESLVLLFRELINFGFYNNEIKDEYSKLMHDGRINFDLFLRLF